MRGTLLLIILNAQSILSINKYCLICKTHTLCKYTKAGPSEKCVDYRNFSLTSENKTDIKDAHNILRNVVASGKYMNHKNIKFPEASAMNLLKWNEELSWIAQRWADQCPSERNNDECRNIQDYNVGQNIYSIKIQSNNIPQYSELLQTQWSEEEKKFTIEDSTKFDSLWDNKLKSFSQSIWDTVQYIGCGVSSFKINEEGEPNTTHTLLIVCNFAPAGNIPNSPIYKLGKPCSECPSKFCNVKYNNLCDTTETNDSKFTKKQVERLFENVMSPWDWKTKLKVKRVYPRKIRGFWYDGECRCNFIYRSKGHDLYYFYNFSMCANLLFFITLF
ncbi:hypothetical protein WA026_017216 [Henosepilachna vigintioctopunctata]|uniref:SCP domain-containing protein n=1 Tax=Henosepilachna vigintioctopunctata TaxID=420089 RepID=A0AAW1UDF4_9CUCU